MYTTRRLGKIGRDRLFARHSIIVAGVVAIVTIILVAVSARALTNNWAGFETEAGTRTANPVMTSDTTASGGNTTIFGVSSEDGCPAYPEFPDANCTGWQHTGVSLQAVPG